MAGQIIPLYPDSGTDAARVQGIPVSVVDPTTGQILQYDLATRQYVPVDYVGKAGGTFTGNLTLNGTANTAPNQTAASGSSLMTRDLVDSRVGKLTVVTASADINITSGSLVNLTGMTAALDASSIYEVTGFLAVQTTGGTPTTNRVQFRWAYSGTLQTVQGLMLNVVTSGNGVYPMMNGAFLTTGFADTANVDRTFPIFANVRTNAAGDLTLQAWKIQGSSTPMLLAGSTFICRKIV